METFGIGRFPIISAIVGIGIGQCVGCGWCEEEGCECGGSGGCYGERGDVGWNVGHCGGAVAGCWCGCR